MACTNMYMCCTAQAETKGFLLHNFTSKKHKGRSAELRPFIDYTKVLLRPPVQRRVNCSGCPSRTWKLTSAPFLQLY